MKFQVFLLLVCFGIVLGQNDTSIADLDLLLDGNATTNGSLEQTTAGTSLSGNATSSAVETSTAAVPEATHMQSEAAPPPVNSYRFNDTINKYCIQLYSAVQFSISYQTTDGHGIAVFNANNGTVKQATSNCGNSSTLPAVLDISYDGFNVTYTFASNADNNKYMLLNVRLNYTYTDDLFPKHAQSGSHLSVAVLNTTFEVSLGKSFRCDVGGKFQLDDENSTITISSLKYVAFSENELDDFGDAEECSGDFTTSDIVPIAVGCALAALVVIVLIAYLIGRRRSRQKGYQSV